MKKISFTIFFPIAFALLMILSASTASAQQMLNASGTVVDADGQPVAGVVVKVVGGTTGTSTDGNGKFSINAPQGSMLEFRFIGMLPQKVRSAANMRVVMKDNAKELDVVVVTGYQKIQNRVFTGAATSVKMDEIKMEGVADISRMLEGHVPGLSIQNVSNSFGSAPRINIRGGASILGNVQPLWVIDGSVYEDLVPLTVDQLTSGDAVTLISSAVAGLNAADIADIQVLKDASATSMYGARALNGVIVITTRSGRRNTPYKVNYSFEISMRSKPSYKQFDMLNSQESMAIYQEMSNKGYLGLSDALYGRRGGVYYQMYKAISTINPNTGEYYLPNTDAAKMAFLRSAEMANTNWFDELFTYNPIHSHTITISGGGERSALYASLGFYHDAGWTIADNVKRFTASIKNTYYWGEKFYATVSLQGNTRNQLAPGTVPQRKNTTLGTFERDFDINPFSYALSTSRTLSPRNNDGTLSYYRNNWADFNILNEYDNNYMNIKVVDLKAQADMVWKPIPELELKGLLTVRRASTSTSHRITDRSNVVGAYRADETPQVAEENIYLYHNKDDQMKQPQVVLGQGGIFNKTETILESLMGRLSADYTKRWGEHDLRAFTFAEFRHADRSISSFAGYGIQYDKGGQVFPDPGIFSKLADENSPYFSLLERNERGITFSGSASYGYKGKYISNVVANVEGSNSAGAGSQARWLPTWNIGGKWNMHEEEWLKHNRVLSRLALRVGYGLTAKMNELAVNSTAIFQNSILSRFNVADRENVLRIKHLENRDLTWEKMYEFNLGIDIGLFNNRYTASIDLYQRNSFDLIDQVRTSGIGGEYYKWANFGDMVARGIELNLSGRIIDTHDFRWASTITFSFIDQKITKLLNAPNAFDMVAGAGRGNITGYPRGSLFSFAFQGLTNEGLPTFDFGLYPINETELTKIAGADFVDAQYTKTYLIYHGPVEPNILGGLSNTLRYKNWELSFLISMQMGNKIRLNPTFDMQWGDLNVFNSEWLNRWLQPGDEQYTNVPVIPSRDLINAYGRENIEKAYNTYNYSQMRVVDGGFVRMKNISLGYTLPQKALHKWRISSLSVKFNITNPFMIYSDKRLNGQDPEYYRTGGVSMPTPQQYTLTLNIGY